VASCLWMGDNIDSFYGENEHINYFRNNFPTHFKQKELAQFPNQVGEIHIDKSLACEDEGIIS
jgi:hypothetical protein